MPTGTTGRGRPSDYGDVPFWTGFVVGGGWHSRGMPRSGSRSSTSSRGAGPTTEPLPGHLVERLRAGKVVPFVGAGVSRAVCTLKTTTPLFPNWLELLRRAAEKLREELEEHGATTVERALDEHDYLEAARVACDRLGKPLWTSFLRHEIDKEFEHVHLRSLRLAELIWRWGSSFVISTNYDNVLKWACPNQHNHRALRISQAAELSGSLDEIKRPTVWHLHGHIDDADKLILAPDGYRKLYVNGVGEGDYRAALACLQAVLAQRTLVFVGFSFDDASVKQQIEWVQEIFKGHAGPHYALVSAGESPRFRGSLKDLGIKPVSFEGFGEPLERRALDLARAARGIEPHDGSDRERLAEWLALAYDNPSVMHASVGTRVKKKLAKPDADMKLGPVARSIVEQLEAHGGIDTGLFGLLKHRAWDREALAEIEERLLPPPSHVTTGTGASTGTTRPPDPHPSYSELALDRRKAWTTLEKEITVPDGPQQAQLHVIYGSPREDLHLFNQRIKTHAQHTFRCNYLAIDRWDDGRMADSRKEWSLRARRTGELGKCLADLTMNGPLLVLFMERVGPLKPNAVRSGLPSFIREDLLPAIAKRKQTKHKVHIVLVLEVDDPSTPPSIDELCGGASDAKLKRHPPIEVEPPTWGKDIEPFIREYYPLGNEAIQRIKRAYDRRKLEQKRFGELTRELDALITAESTKKK